MDLSLNSLQRADVPLNKETKPINAFVNNRSNDYHFVWEKCQRNQKSTKRIKTPVHNIRTNFWILNNQSTTQIFLLNLYFLSNYYKDKKEYINE